MTEPDVHFLDRQLERRRLIQTPTATGPTTAPYARSMALWPSGFGFIASSRYRNGVAGLPDARDPRGAPA